MSALYILQVLVAISAWLKPISCDQLWQRTTERIEAQKKGISWSSLAPVLSQLESPKPQTKRSAQTWKALQLTQVQLSGKFKAFSWTWHNINTHLHICLISFSFSIVGGHFSSALTLRWFSCLWVCTLFTFRAFWPKSLLVQTCFFPCNNPSLNFKCHRLKTGSATKIHQRLLDNRHSFHVRNAVGRGATSNGCTGRGGAPQGFTKSFERLDAKEPMEPQLPQPP